MYEINEQQARRAKEMNSYYDYEQGSATETYRAAVEKAQAIAEAQKAKTDPIYHDKIDALLNKYCRKLAANLNDSYRIECMCPSVMVAGPANFPVRKKEKQNAARVKNMSEWEDVQGILRKIEAVGTGGISSDDPNALDKLRSKLAELEVRQQDMKLANAYYRKHKTMKGYDGVTDEQATRLDKQIAEGYSWERCPYPAYQLTNNNANIKRTRERIEAMEKHAAAPAEGWTFDGGEVVINTEANRLQIVYPGKPDEATRTALKSNGFKWSPRFKAWQRMLTDNAIRAAKRVTEGRA